MDKVDAKWLEVIFPENATAEDLFEFFRMNMTVSVNVNTKEISFVKGSKEWS